MEGCAVVPVTVVTAEKASVASEGSRLVVSIAPVALSSWVVGERVTPLVAFGTSRLMAVASNGALVAFVEAVTVRWVHISSAVVFWGVFRVVLRGSWVPTGLLVAGMCFCAVGVSSKLTRQDQKSDKFMVEWTKTHPRDRQNATCPRTAGHSTFPGLWTRRPRSPGLAGSWAGAVSSSGTTRGCRQTTSRGPWKGRSTRFARPTLSARPDSPLLSVCWPDQTQGSYSESERHSTIWPQRQMCTHLSRRCLRFGVKTQREVSISAFKWTQTPACSHSPWQIKLLLAVQSLSNHSPRPSNAAHPSRLLFCGSSTRQLK